MATGQVEKRVITPKKCARRKMLLKLFRFSKNFFRAFFLQLENFLYFLDENEVLNFDCTPKWHRGVNPVVELSGEVDLDRVSGYLNIFK